MNELTLYAWGLIAAVGSVGIWQAIHWLREHHYRLYIRFRLAQYDHHAWESVHPYPRPYPTRPLPRRNHLW